jgi:hypothetical protein
VNAYFPAGRWYDYYTVSVNKMTSVDKLLSLWNATVVKISSFNRLFVYIVNAAKISCDADFHMKDLPMNYH